MNKHTVAILKDTQVVEHLTKDLHLTGWYTKTFFYFLRANHSNSAVVTVKGKRNNSGEGQVLQIPCTINSLSAIPTK